MPTAVGRLRYGPRSSTVPRKGWWMILECDPDWHPMVAPQVHKAIPGDWMMAVDRDRVPTGSHEVVAPRLALVKPQFLMPAWGPHISMVRGEKPVYYRDVWERQVRIGDTQQKVRQLGLAAEHWTKKADEYAVLVAEIGAGVLPKRRDKAEADLADMRNRAAGQVRRQAKAERELERMLRTWEHHRKTHMLPTWLLSGTELTFWFEEELQLGRTHWWFTVGCKKVRAIREFYGLRPWPKVRLHLTVGVTESL